MDPTIAIITAMPLLTFIAGLFLGLWLKIEIIKSKG